MDEILTKSRCQNQTSVFAKASESYVASSCCVWLSSTQVSCILVVTALYLWLLLSKIFWLLKFIALLSVFVWQWRIGRLRSIELRSKTLFHNVKCVLRPRSNSSASPRPLATAFGIVLQSKLRHWPFCIVTRANFSLPFLLIRLTWVREKSVSWGNKYSLWLSGTGRPIHKG
jgi:hypothetical protein